VIHSEGKVASRAPLVVTDQTSTRVTSYQVQAFSVHAVLACFYDAVLSRVRARSAVAFCRESNGSGLTCLWLSVESLQRGLTALFAEPIGESPCGGSVVLLHEVSASLFDARGLHDWKHPKNAASLVHSGLVRLQPMTGAIGTVSVSSRLLLGDAEIILGSMWDRDLTGVGMHGGALNSGRKDTLLSAKDMARRMDEAVKSWFQKDTEKWKGHLACAVLRGLSASVVAQVGHSSSRRVESHTRQANSIWAGNVTGFVSMSNACMQHDALPSLKPSRWGTASTFAGGAAAGTGSSQPSSAQGTPMRSQWASTLFLPLPHAGLSQDGAKMTDRAVRVLRGTAAAIASWNMLRWHSTVMPHSLLRLPSSSLHKSSSRTPRTAYASVSSESQSGIEYDLEAAIPHVVWAEASVPLLQIDERAARTDFFDSSQHRAPDGSSGGGSMAANDYDGSLYSGIELPALASTDGAFGRVLNRTLCAELALSTCGFALDSTELEHQDDVPLSVSDLKNALFLVQGNARAFVLAVEWLRASREGGTSSTGSSSRPSRTMDLLPLRARLGVLEGSGVVERQKFALSDVAELSSALLALSTTALLAATEQWCVLAENESGLYQRRSGPGPGPGPVSPDSTSYGTGPHEVADGDKSAPSPDPTSRCQELRLCPSPFP